MSTSDSEKYILSALLDADSFFYALLDAQSLITYDTGKSNLSDIKYLIEEKPIQPLLSKVATWTDQMTIIPKDDYDASHIEAYLRTDKPNLSLSYQADFLQDSNAYLCYAVPTFHLQRLSDDISVSKVNHLITALYSSLSTAYSRSILLHRHEKITLLLAINEGRMMAFSTVHEASPVSLLYNVSLVTEKHNVMKDTIIILSGDFHKEGQTKKLISKYFPIEVLGPSFYLESIYRCAL